MIAVVPGKATCPRCNGRAWIGHAPCEFCEGTGVITAQRVIPAIKVPPSPIEAPGTASIPSSPVPDTKDQTS